MYKNIEYHQNVLQYYYNLEHDSYLKDYKQNYFPNLEFYLRSNMRFV